MIEGAMFRAERDVAFNVPLAAEDSRKIYVVIKVLACVLLAVLAMMDTALLWRLICVAGMVAVGCAPLHKYISTVTEFSTPLSIALVESKPMRGKSSHGRIVVAVGEQRAWAADLESGYLELPQQLYSDLDQSVENGAVVRLLVGHTPDRKYVWVATFNFTPTEEDFRRIVDDFVTDIESRSETIYTNFENWYDTEGESF